MTDQTGFTIRPLNADDVDPIAHLELELFPDEAWDFFMLIEETSHPDRRYAVAEQAGAIVGYAGLMLAGDTADIHTIGTSVPGRGIGQSLLAWLEQAAREGGAERILLEVRADNSRARAFYARAGFTEIGRRPGYYRTRRGAIDAIVMEKPLLA